MNLEEIKSLLSSLQGLLHQQGERNWIRGVTAALDALDAADGLNKARSIYGSMNRGVGSFADYNIWIDDFDARVKANQGLDSLRAQLWSAFDL